MDLWYVSTDIWRPQKNEFPSPPQINSLWIQQQAFSQATELMIAHLHVDLFVEEMPMEKTETTPTPVAAKITLIKLQYATKMGGDQNKKKP